MIHMHRDFNKEEQIIFHQISFLTGSAEGMSDAVRAPVKKPFNEHVVEFLDDLSGYLMKHPQARQYPDVVTFAFWIRRGSVVRMAEKYHMDDCGCIRMGRGMAFHVAPSNVPVNFAYSLAAGLLCGNKNIVRIPSKEFPQTRIITEGIGRILENHKNLRQYITLVRYERQKVINDLLSAIADVRIIWGGDQTVADIRMSPLSPRGTEVVFADRYSAAVIDSDVYMCLNQPDREVVDLGFYNDTYLFDQNACTSPQIVIWLGNRKQEAKEKFWTSLHSLVREKYRFADIMGVQKLTDSCLAAINVPGLRILPHADNLIICAVVTRVEPSLMEYRSSCGFFFEYDCDNILELEQLADDIRCQTVAVLGDRQQLIAMLESGVRGIDRIVDIGRTMDFGMVWDGYRFTDCLTRSIHI